MAVVDTLKDAAYVTIGLGVLGFQKAQVRRVELTKQIESQVKGLEASVAEGRKAVSGLATQVETMVAPVRTQIEAQLDSLEAALPAGVADVLKQARTVALEAEGTVRKSLGFAA